MVMRFHSLDNYSHYKAMNVILEEDPANGTGILWLGDYTAATDKNTLKQRGVKTVLTVAQGLNISYPASYEIHHKTYMILDIESANISKIFNDTYNQIEAGLKIGGVLVHCAAGVSRSASTVIAFLMRKNNWSYSEAFQFVKQRRFVICPNFGFQRQLRAYESQVKQLNAQNNSSSNNNQQSTQPQQQQFQPTKEQQRITYLQQLQQIQQIWSPEQQKNQNNPQQLEVTSTAKKFQSVSRQQQTQQTAKKAPITPNNDKLMQQKTPAGVKNFTENKQKSQLSGSSIQQKQLFSKSEVKPSMNVGPLALQKRFYQR